MKTLLLIAAGALLLGVFLGALAAEVQAALEDMRSRFPGGEE